MSAIGQVQVQIAEGGDVSVRAAASEQLAPPCWRTACA